MPGPWGNFLGSAVGIPRVAVEVGGVGVSELDGVVGIAEGAGGVLADCGPTPVRGEAWTSHWVDTH